MGKHNTLVDGHLLTEKQAAIYRDVKNGDSLASLYAKHGTGFRRMLKCLTNIVGEENLPTERRLAYKKRNKLTEAVSEMKTACERCGLRGPHECIKAPVGGTQSALAICADWHDAGLSCRVEHQREKQLPNGQRRSDRAHPWVTVRYSSKGAVLNTTAEDAQLLYEGDDFDALRSISIERYPGREDS